MMGLRHYFAIMTLGTGLTLFGAGFSAAQAAKLADGDFAGLSCTNGTVSLLGAGYTACAGAFSGNDTGSQGTLLDKLNSGSIFAGEYTTVADASWEILGKSDEGGQVLAANGSTAGSWSAMLDQVYSTIAVSLKSSTSYSTYLFTNVKSAELAGLFDTAGTSVNKKGNAQGLSHLTIAYYNAPPPPVIPTQDTPDAIPEPSTMVGILMLGAMAASRFKRVP